jgi:hypothetical protein
MMKRVNMKGRKGMIWGRGEISPTPQKFALEMKFVICSNKSGIEGKEEKM